MIGRYPLNNGLLAIALLAAGCGRNQSSEQQVPGQPRLGSQATAPRPGDYSGEGDVTQIEGDKVAISHGPIKGIGWPARTMTFRAGSPDMLSGIEPGQPVAFSFRKQGNDYVLTSLGKSG